MARTVGSEKAPSGKTLTKCDPAARTDEERRIAADRGFRCPLSQSLLGPVEGLKRTIALFALALSTVLPLIASPRTVTVEFRVFPGLAQMDGNWAALTVAHDGRAYAGLACHGCDGHLVMYDPKSDQITDLGNLTALTGESALHIGPQSKIHAKFREGKDGRIFFATHAGWWFNYARVGTKEGYPGSHWMAFDPNSGKVQDFGIGPRYEGMNTGAYDPRYNRIYGLTHPRGHFVYYDVATGKTVDKGRLNNWESICRTLGIDDEGRVYGNFGAGQIYRYDPRTDEITELPVHIPVREKGISLGRDYFKSETHWRTVVWDQQTRKFYGLDESASFVFSYDPYAGPYGEVKKLGQLCVEGMEDRRDISYATLALALGLDRNLYYAAPEREFDYAGSAGIGASHLLTYALNTGKKEDLGEMHLPDGRRVIGLNSADTSPDGTIYFVGAIEVRGQQGPDAESAGKIGGVPYRLALVIYRPQRHGQ